MKILLFVLLILFLFKILKISISWKILKIVLIIGLLLFVFQHFAKAQDSFWNGYYSPPSNNKDKYGYLAEETFKKIFSTPKDTTIIINKKEQKQISVDVEKKVNSDVGALISEKKSLREQKKDIRLKKKELRQKIKDLRRLKRNIKKLNKGKV